MSNIEKNTESFSDLLIVIENKKGTYKSFETEGDPVWEKYPLKGVTYPVDYGYIEGYLSEDGHNLDVFVGSGEIFGFMKIWRLDVSVETKFFSKLTTEELRDVLTTFAPVVLSHEIFAEEILMIKLHEFKSKKS